MKKADISEWEKLLGKRAKPARNRARTPDRLSEKNLIRPFAKINIMIVHQACWIRRALRSLIDGTGRFAVCAETDNPKSAIALFEQHQPKIVVIGVVISRGDGLQLIKTLLKLAPTALILVISWDESVISICRALRAGAVGYLTLEDGDLELPIALDTITAGTYYISKSLLNIVLKSFAHGLLGGANRGTDLLTDRELEVFTLVGRGAGILEIAKEMGVSAKTVETHQMHIKQKLNLASAAELRKCAMRSVSKPARTMAWGG
jgi:DNA-binding NarL/FixJ family response regulator